ncbi:hypothetical protein PR048_031107 [Dryococelus australis]|uniref:Uncharacterized protein n=1 Tax=Dryococelus australis TaxID=614101 RepID=A0ABQ9G4B3_9NEOP|nr:hypothetical protein PR048_031107 [Dryococelus australis]
MEHCTRLYNAKNCLWSTAPDYTTNHNTRRFIFHRHISHREIKFKSFRTLEFRKEVRAVFESSGKYTTEIKRINIWNYFSYVVTNFTGRMSLGAPIKIYAAVTLLASHQGEQESIPGWVTLGLSHMGFVLDDASDHVTAGRTDDWRVRWMVVSPASGSQKRNDVAIPLMYSRPLADWLGSANLYVYCLGEYVAGRAKREIPEKTHRPAASSGTIPICENPGSPWWEASRLTAQPPWPHRQSNELTTDVRSLVAYRLTVRRHDGNTARLARRSDVALGVHVSVARIAPSLFDLEYGVPTAAHPNLNDAVVPSMFACPFPDLPCGALEMGLHSDWLLRVAKESLLAVAYMSSGADRRTYVPTCCGPAGCTTRWPQISQEVYRSDKPCAEILSHSIPVSGNVDDVRVIRRDSPPVLSPVLSAGQQGKLLAWDVTAGPDNRSSSLVNPHVARGGGFTAGVAIKAEAARNQSPCPNIELLFRQYDLEKTAWIGFDWMQRFGRLLTSRGGGNGRSPRKPADQLHRRARFPGRGLNSDLLEPPEPQTGGGPSDCATGGRVFVMTTEIVYCAVLTTSPSLGSWSLGEFRNQRVDAGEVALSGAASTDRKFPSSGLLVLTARWPITRGSLDQPLPHRVAVRSWRTLPGGWGVGAKLLGASRGTTVDKSPWVACGLGRLPFPRQTHPPSPPPLPFITLLTPTPILNQLLHKNVCGVDVFIGRFTVINVLKRIDHSMVVIVLLTEEFSEAWPNTFLASGSSWHLLRVLASRRSPAIVFTGSRLFAMCKFAGFIYSCGSHITPTNVARHDKKTAATTQHLYFQCDYSKSQPGSLLTPHDELYTLCVVPYDTTKIEIMYNGMTELSGSRQIYLIDCLVSSVVSGMCRACRGYVTPALYGESLVKNIKIFKDTPGHNELKMVISEQMCSADSSLALAAEFPGINHGESCRTRAVKLLLSVRVADKELQLSRHVLSHDRMAPLSPFCLIARTCKACIDSVVMLYCANQIHVVERCREEKIPRGSTRVRWLDAIKEGIRKADIPEEEWRDRALWRRLVGEAMDRLGPVMPSQSNIEWLLLSARHLRDREVRGEEKARQRVTSGSGEKRNTAVHSERRRLVSNLIAKCDEAVQKCYAFTVNQTAARDADYAGVSQTLIRNIRKEQKELDNSGEGVDFPWSHTSLHKVVKQLGFRRKKSRSHRKILIERPHILSWRHDYLVAVKQHRQDVIDSIVVRLDYSSDSSSASDACSSSSEQDNPVQSYSVGRLIVPRSHSCQGFRAGARAVHLLEVLRLMQTCAMCVVTEMVALAGWEELPRNSGTWAGQSVSQRYREACFPP